MPKKMTIFVAVRLTLRNYIAEIYWIEKLSLLEDHIYE